MEESRYRVDHPGGKRRTDLSRSHRTDSASCSGCHRCAAAGAIDCDDRAATGFWGCPVSRRDSAYLCAPARCGARAGPQRAGSWFWVRGAGFWPEGMTGIIERTLTEKDLDEIVAIEVASFSNPWT